MKPKPLLLTAAIALLLAGCQSDPKPETAPATGTAEKTAAAAPAAAAAAPTPAAVKAEAAGKTGTEKKTSALDELLGGGKRPSIVDTDSFNETERSIIRAQERERARDPQNLGPGVYDKESKARKDWVF